MRKTVLIIVVGIALLFAYAFWRMEALNSRVSRLDDQVGNLVKAAPSYEAAVNQARDAAARAESAAANAMTAEKRSAKEFELMQKK